MRRSETAQGQDWLALRTCFFVLVLTGDECTAVRKSGGETRWCLARQADHRFKTLHGETAWFLSDIRHGRHYTDKTGISA